MKLILNAFFLCTIIAAPAAAQDYYGAPGAYDRYNNGYDRLVPPLPVPGYSVGTTQSVVTTRRIIGSPPPYVGYGDPDTVVTTRRVVAPRPILEEGDLDVGSVLPAPSPYRRSVRDVTVVAPGYPPANVIVAPRFAPAAPVIIEERRVETIRRVLRPGGGEWLQ
jgi:hypothetical protein